MTFQHTIVVLLALCLLCSCGKNRPAFEKVNLGETEAEVIAKLGAPSSTALSGEVKYLEYPAWDFNGWTGHRENHRTYFVRLINGKVDAYGQKGDFDSTKDPGSAVTVKVQNESERKSNPGGASIAEKLREIEKLKADGVISEDEYKTMRKRIIDSQ
jgi:hypothetical protein